MPTIKEAVQILETLRNSTVITFITDSRVMIESKDCLMLADNLDKISGIGLKKIPRLDLILQSHGGLVESAYRFVEICKDYSEEFNVIIPLAAKSAATIIALSANEIIMSSVSELGPVDPIIQHPENANIRIPAKSIKDYFRLIESDQTTKESLNISPQTKELLNNKLDPYLLGSYESAMQSSKEILSILLRMRNEFKDSTENTNKVINEFTESHSSHSFPITRNRLIELGFNKIIKTEDNPELHVAIKNVFNIYLHFMRQTNSIRLHGNREQNITEQIKQQSNPQELIPPINFG